MTGVYFTAAELSRRGYIVSPTSRSARGADLLVTDQSCLNAWSVQVKTNAAERNSWQVGREDALVVSQTHFFVFVGSSDVATKVRGKERAYFNRGDGPKDEGWELLEKQRSMCSHGRMPAKLLGSPSFTRRRDWRRL
jgi:hypothetical protein